ncbi:hypothetical protein [Aneurinibacillus danicus]|uniref:hypothetical protein n=1 Tax=Aneurinibacillus danicus TaxID=267746 RepID=UPI0011BFCE40|nr:hypothetical protein [Aneurinibacillus danicus]
MSFLKDLIKMLMGNKKHGYRHYSSSDYRHRRPKHYGHSYYGHSHYKRKHSSRSFFSSGGFFRS